MIAVLAGLVFSNIGFSLYYTAVDSIDRCRSSNKVKPAGDDSSRIDDNSTASQSRVGNVQDLTPASMLNQSS